MPDGNADLHDLPAGDFGPWVVGMLRAVDGDDDAEVPCGACTACCTSSQFVHIAPGETDTLASIPPELLFPAPRLPQGHVLLGYDERGHCPMLIDGRCSIYAHRPHTCRTYDCRVFPAAGIDPDEDKVSIARQARRWAFDHPTLADRARHEAVRAAAAHLAGEHHVLPDEPAPVTATQVAVLAVRIHDVFMGRDEATGQPEVADPSADAVRVEVMRRTGRQRRGA
jgi:Fe-S-cluster containining protein